MSGSDYFPGQHEHEEVIFFFHKHWLELIYPVGKFLIEQFIIGTVVLLMYFQGDTFIHTTEGRIMVFMVVGAMIITMLKLWIRIFNHLLRVVIVTNYRIIDTQQKILVTNDQDVIDLRQLQDIKAETHGFFRTVVFHCGTLTFALTAASMDKMLHNVPRPRKTAARITQVREQYWQRPPITTGDSQFPHS